MNNHDGFILSYDDVDGDISLSQFKLQKEDLMYKIPVIKQSLDISKRNISFFGSPWSSPAWMKTNGNMTGKGTIKYGPGGPYSKAWAQYFVKFVKAYKEQGVDIWGLTTHNQPGDGQAGGFLVHRLGWTAETYRDFIAKDLGPALEGAGLGYLKLIILDDEQQFHSYWSEVILNDPMVAKHVSGIALHWYKESAIPMIAINDTYREFGDKYFMISIMGSEHGVLNKSNSVQLGNWARGEEYFNNILVGLQHRLTGWVDWNMALDMTGGPNWNKNFADSPIIVDADNDVFYKQPTFYAMGHFSKFFRIGSKVIEYHMNGTSNSEVEAIFVARPDNSIAANFLNRNESSVAITITDPMIAGYMNFELPAKSFVTFVWYRI